MKYLLTIFLATLLSFITMAQAGTYKPQKPIEIVNKSMSSIEKNVRKAAVKVLTQGGGHGSGSVVQYKDLQPIFTARHVTDAAIGTVYMIERDKKLIPAKLIHQSPSQDMAVLLLSEPFPKDIVEPMPWRPAKDHKVGTRIVYSGYPSWHSLMSFDGRIAGSEVIPSAGTQLMVNTYGWFGCSGSVIYNTSGHIIGILYGVDVEYYPGVQIQENMIWVAPIKYLPIENTLKEFCEKDSHNYKACR